MFLINALVFLIFVVFWLVSFVILYHLLRFGIGVLPKKLAGLFLLGAVILFCTSLLLYQRVEFNWLPL